MRDCVTFVLNGEVVSLRNVAPTMTVLNYLRRSRRLTGSKEGCAEGDCGACTVAIGELVDGAVCYRAVNACIQLLPMLEGKALVTVEALKQPENFKAGAGAGRLHPVQQALVDLNGSQCGFCTPGFVMSLYAAYVGGEKPSRSKVNDLLAGNLCRCTGYGPILDAADEMYRYQRPEWDDERRAVERRRLEQIAHNETVVISHCCQGSDGRDSGGQSQGGQGSGGQGQAAQGPGEQSQVGQGPGDQAFYLLEILKNLPGFMLLIHRQHWWQAQPTSDYGSQNSIALSKR